jgi:hypothetical protein
MVRSGEVTRLVCEAIRDKKSIWPREIAKAAMAAKGISETDKAIREEIVSRFTNVVYDLARRGQLVKIGHGEGARWTLAPKERDLL